jgi:hypothetical protein
MNRNPMPYTLGQAARAAGVSKTTLHRAIKSGRISAARDDAGGYAIDPAELHRVFPPTVPGNGHAAPGVERTVTAELTPGTAALERELELVRAERDRERGQLLGQIADLQRRLDLAEQERRDKDRRLTALLTDGRVPPRWLGWLRRRAPAPGQGGAA